MVKILRISNLSSQKMKNKEEERSGTKREDVTQKNLKRGDINNQIYIAYIILLEILVEKEGVHCILKPKGNA